MWDHCFLSHSRKLLKIVTYYVQAELDIFTEKLAVSEMKQKEKEAQVLAAEAEFNRLNRR